MRLTHSHSKWVIAFFTLPFSPCYSIIKLHALSVLWHGVAEIMNVEAGWHFWNFQLCILFIFVCIFVCHSELIIRLKTCISTLHCALEKKNNVAPKIMIVWRIYHICTYIPIIQSFIQIGCWLCSKYTVHLQECWPQSNLVIFGTLQM